MPSLIVGLLHNFRIPGIGLEGDRVPPATLLLGAHSATTRREATCSGRPVNLTCAALPATQLGPPAERKLDAQRHGISRCRSRRTPASRRARRYRRAAPRYASHTRGLRRGIDPRHPIIAGIARSVRLAHPSTVPTCPARHTPGGARLGVEAVSAVPSWRRTLCRCGLCVRDQPWLNLQVAPCRTDSRP
jgi:hypothetical protein